MMAEGGEPKIKIEPLGPSHDRAAFSCGEEYIDKWCKKTAHKDHEKYRSRVFVATPTNSNIVIGVYSMTIRSLAPKTFLNVGFGSWEIPAIYFATLGVCKTHEKQGIGTALMVDAFKRALRVAEEVGAYCLWLESVSEEKAKFYEARQFTRFKPDELKMYVLMETLRDAFKP